MTIKELIFTGYYKYNKHFPLNRGKAFLSNTLNSIFGPFWIKIHNGIYLRLFVNSPMDLSYLEKNNDSHNIIVSAINQLKPGETFVDVGANIGFLSLYASKKLGDQSLIYSFEPSYREYKRLLDNIERNKATNVLPYNIAIGNENKHVQLTIERHHTGLNKVATNTNHMKDSSFINIPMMKLDEIMPQKPIGLMKIDVEGAELFVLKGMSQLLSLKFISKIIIEITPKFLNEFGSSKEDIYSFLKMYGYASRYNHEAWQYDEVFELIEEE